MGRLTGDAKTEVAQEVVTDTNDQPVTCNDKHTHPPKATETAVEMVKERMKKRAKEETALIPLILSRSTAGSGPVCEPWDHSPSSTNLFLNAVQHLQKVMWEVASPPTFCWRLKLWRRMIKNPEWRRLLVRLQRWCMYSCFPQTPTPHCRSPLPLQGWDFSDLSSSVLPCRYSHYMPSSTGSSFHWCTFCFQARAEKPTILASSFSRRQHKT